MFIQMIGQVNLATIASNKILNPPYLTESDPEFTKGIRGAKIQFCQMSQNKLHEVKKILVRVYGDSPGTPLDPPMPNLQQHVHNFMHKLVKPYATPFAKDVMLQ